jgi:hypothetical protein
VQRARGERERERDSGRRAQSAALKEATEARDAASREAKKMKLKNEKYKEQVLSVYIPTKSRYCLSIRSLLLRLASSLWHPTFPTNHTHPTLAQVLQTHGKYTRAKQELQRQRSETQALRDANELQVQHALSRVQELEREREMLVRGRERELFSSSPSGGDGDFGVKGLHQQGELQERELTKYLSNLENLGKEANASGAGGSR